MMTFVDLLLDLGEEINLDIGGDFFLAFCFAPPLIWERKGMLGVELDLAIFQLWELINECQLGVHGRYFCPANIKQDAPGLDIWPIWNAETRKYR